MSMMSKDSLLIDASYVKTSSYRVKVVNVLEGTDVMIPTSIAKNCGILPNHISKVLRELKDKGIVECLNEDARKGRLYRLTDYGVKVVNVLGEIF